MIRIIFNWFFVFIIIEYIEKKKRKRMIISWLSWLVYKFCDIAFMYAPFFDRYIFEILFRTDGKR